MLLGAAAVGQVRVPPLVVAKVALGHVPGLSGLLSRDWGPAVEAIVWEIRLPRVTQGAAVGAALGLAGAALQGMFRNPMADPYVLGISSGAALGAALAMIVGLQVRFLGLTAVPLLALLGALASICLVYHLARSGGGLPTVSLLLAGVSVGTVLAAVVALLMVLAHEQMERIVFWLMGGLASSRWDQMLAVSPYLALGAALLLLRARDLNLLLLGEESARHLGVEVDRAKAWVLGGASLVTAAAVSVSGSIAFVGLLVPHIARLLVGPDHRDLLPASALAGAALLVLSDLVARVAVAPAELPVGVVTALLGGPFFLYLLRRSRGRAFPG
ncbi:MAG: iron chelate uptake ABC transporter family permease subunit [Acetobacteraceae bacterium]|nr:iron chelate uptake ABC transporter family permease subunit [Acetobacteraceae bacterium]